MMKEIFVPPEWLNDKLFVSVVDGDVANFAQIQNFSVKPAFAVGENYLFILWSVEIEAKLRDGSKKEIKYLLKVPSKSPDAIAIMTLMSSFKREIMSYYQLLPTFKRMYLRKGLVIHLAPRAFQFSTDLGEDVILLKDIRERGFKTMNRLEGLDMNHTEWALKKLAQYHAASAAYFAEGNSIPEYLMEPLLDDDLLELLEKSQKVQDKKFLENLKLYNAEHMREKIIKYQSIYLKQAREVDLYATKHPGGFYVYSHGDCSSNNIMFQHDENDQITETLFINFQAGRYVTPALDLQYFLLLCPSLDIKFKLFDHFVQYYHQELEKHLKILNYSKAIPSLRQIHKLLYKTSCMGYTVVIKSLPIFLFDPISTEDISTDNTMGDKSDGSNVQHNVYTNELYSKHMQQILPWMENRGYFE